ncbi:MAG: phosphatidylserine decarboxylase [Thermoanaerobaculia bacterium]
MLPFAALSAVLFALRHPGWGAAALGAGVLLLLFFRDPRRRFQGSEGALLSAADGLVTRVDRVAAPDVGPGTFQRVVTFLSVFDVHVQKTPVAGRVVAARHSPGRKVAAFRHEAGDVNEQRLTVIETAAGERVAVRQIAGLLARRVVCPLGEGEEVERGRPMGLIKFGSRVDVLMPERFRVVVERGQRVKNGLTVIAEPAEPPPGASPEAD